MTWTVAHEKKCRELLGEWRRASGRARIQLQIRLINVMFLPHVKRWATIALRTRTWLPKDASQDLLIDVSAQLALNDFAELRAMAELPEPKTGEAVDHETDLPATDEEPVSSATDPIRACEVVLADLSLRENMPIADLMTGTPIQQRLRALHRFALLRRIDGRHPTWVPKDERAKTPYYNFEQSHVHAGTRTLEQMLNEYRGGTNNLDEVLEHPLVKRAQQHINSMKELDRKIYLAAVDGMKPREIAASFDLDQKIVDRALNSARKALERIRKQLEHEDGTP
jgi:DNA-directed RNA polymerase specialized sigma24 family protein